jgi:hypothetical protein
MGTDGRLLIELTEERGESVGRVYLEGDVGATPYILATARGSSSYVSGAVMLFAREWRRAQLEAASSEEAAAPARSEPRLRVARALPEAEAAAPVAESRPLSPGARSR